MSYDPELHGHSRIHCRTCGYKGWSEDTGGCPRCDDPERGRKNRCEECGVETNHSTRQHQDALEESEARGEDGP